MLPELFRIPGLDLPVYGYGLMIVLGLLGAIQIARFLARRSGLDPEFFVNCAVIAIIVGVVGARVSHVLENLPEYTRADRSAWANFVDAINISSGGLTFFGGLLFGLPFTIGYAVWKKMPVLRGMDVVAPAIMFALGIGRIGCLLNGCCHGAECNLPWALQFPYASNAYIQQYEDGQLDPPPQLVVSETLRDGTTYNRLIQPREIQAQPEPDRSALASVTGRARSNPVHPTQVYSSFNALLISAALLAYYTLPHAAGQVFALMMILKGITRFLLETLRTEPPVLGPMSYSMVIAILLVVGGIVFWLLARRGGIQQVSAAPAPARGSAAPPLPTTAERL
jgi:phosphatidylglycerol---prolipoprotein diacylglyceryl transferase